MPINSFLYPGAKFVPPYQVANSLRFEDGDSAYLERNFSTTQDSRRKFTFSAWVKRGNLTTSTNIWGSSEGSGEGYNSLKFENHKLQYLSGNTSNSGTQVNLETNRLFRDVSAWYHIVLAVDTSQGTDSNRIKFYVNGSQETSFNTSTYPSQDTDLLTSTTPQQTIGMRDLRGTNAQFWDGYMCEVVFIDNQQLTPTSFGEFDEDSPNIWKPKSVSGLTFGTGGYYLEFKQSGTSQNSSGLGADTSGNDQHFAVSNLTAVDQSTDTCTNNFATLNGLHKIDDWSLAQGNLEFTNNSTGHRMTNSNIAVFQGKWYSEVKIVAVSGTIVVGVIDPDKFIYNTFLHNADRGYAYKHSDGQIRFNDGILISSYGASYTTGDIIGIAMDLDNHKLYFSKNGTFQNSGDPTSGSTGTGSAADLATGVFYTFATSTQDAGTNPVIEFNFGGTQTFTISSGNSDGNGYGNFEYSVPSGYYALNSKNLAEFG